MIKFQSFTNLKKKKFQNKKTKKLCEGYWDEKSRGVSNNFVGGSCLQNIPPYGRRVTKTENKIIVKIKNKVKEDFRNL